MAIAKVQSTPPAVALHTITMTFSSPPTAGNVIAVPLITFRQSAGQTVTIGDNQGNTYHLGANSGNNGGSNSYIYYAYNINSSGTFSITVTMNFSDTQVEGTGIEFSGFSAVDPLVGSGTGSGVFTCTTGTTGAAEVAVIACIASYVVNAAITGITVDSSLPTWTQEYQRLVSGFLNLGGEADSRVVSGGGAQAVTWTFTNNNPGSPTCAIIALFGTPPIADLLNYQTSRSVLELADTTSINLYQVSRQVMYPFTCTPGPPPPPPGVTGCVDELSDLSADCSDGCVPEI